MCRVAGIVPGSSPEKIPRVSAVANPPPSRRLVEGWLSPERLAPYLTVTSNDTGAVALYEWNIAACGAFHEVLGMVEVLLRNAMHTQLTRWQERRGRSGAWFDDPATGLTQRSIDDVTTARARLYALETPGRIVAELPFGFWRYLLEWRYQTRLWPRRYGTAFRIWARAAVACCATPCWTCTVCATVSHTTSRSMASTSLGAISSLARLPATSIRLPPAGRNDSPASHTFSSGGRQPQQHSMEADDAADCGV